MFVVGERINAHGSRAVRRMLISGDDAGLVGIARAQVAAGVHALDVCVAIEGRDDEATLMAHVTTLLATAVDVPLAIDSTDPAVIERALERLGGRAIVNSVNMAGRTSVERLVPPAKACGARIVALCIDRDGMARTRDRKLEVARTIYEQVVEQHVVDPGLLLVDALTFPVARDGAESAIETIEGVRLIKRELPGVRTILGISDVSFGLSPDARPAVNEDFLRRCLDAGLDAAILDPTRLTRAKHP